MKVLFLYSEIAGYLVSCLNALSKKGVEIHLVHWPVNKEAPFIFEESSIFKKYERKTLDTGKLMVLADKIAPDVIYCSGWTDKDYLKVCKKFRKKIPVIVGFDNKWKGSLKQKAGALLSKTLLHSCFSHCWIPGKPQLSYAQHFKFKSEQILTGFYSCDHKFFNKIFLRNAEAKRNKFPHRFIFAGRYYDFKGITDLWQAFIESQNEAKNDWELWCLGTGDIDPVQHPKIKHFGFVQPDKMESFMVESGVFVLPSRFEPWGVAVHEFASAGFPLICSNEVGAASEFLEENKNGFLFSPGNISELKAVLKRTMSLTEAEMTEMGRKSAELSFRITPESWSETLMSVVKK